MEVTELLRQYAAGRRDFSFANLQGIDLTGTDLPGISLSQANLEGAVLVQVNLSRSNLRQANLKGANLSQANLSYANLRRANFTHAVLEEAILEGAILTGATLPDGTSYTAPPSQDTDIQSINALEADIQSINALEAEQPISQNSTASPIGEVAAQTSKNLSTFQDFPSRLPWASLLFWWLGFGLVGLLLALHGANFFSWLIAWFSSICWALGESLTWFIPIIAAIAVLSAAGISVWTLGIVGAVIFAVFFNIKFVLGWSVRESLKGSLWVGGIGAIMIQLASWLFTANSGTGYGPLGVPVVAFNTLHLALFLILAVGFTSLGAVAWRQLLAENFNQKETFWIVGFVSVIGLLCGGVIAIACSI